MKARKNLPLPWQIGEKVSDKNFIFLGFKEKRGSHRLYEFQCFCGKTFLDSPCNIRSKRRRSCGCSPARKKSTGIAWYKGPYKDVYQIYGGIKNRCFNKTDRDYRKYGAKGIIMHESWVANFEKFLADIGPRPSKKHSLDRFPNKRGNYEPGNVRWATMSQQQNNKTTNQVVEYEGKEMTIMELSRLTGVEYNLLRDRLVTQKLDVHKALTKPVNQMASLGGKRGWISMNAQKAKLKISEDSTR